jgi:outer membrane receptor for ferric coprogen and ferric-rhodotorulic acid
LSYPTFSLTNSADYQLKQKSTYLASRIHFNDDLKLLMGANYTQATAKGQSYGAPYNYDQDEVVPYTGLTYNITPEYTLYGSYAEVFLPTNRFDTNQLVLDPIEGKTWELGVKSSWLDGELTGSFAYFNNAFEGFPITTGVRLANNQTAYRPQNIESDGFELNLAGQITDEINTSFGFVHLRHMSDSDTQEDVRTFVPLDSYSANENLRQDDYILLNAMASYEVNPHMTIQANGNNLTNEKYLNSLEYGQSFYGEPANYTVALRFKY